jgi:hypothetical protein
MNKHESSVKKELFLEKRSLEGKSFDQISEELDVSKTTLIRWSKEYREELLELSKLKFAVFFESHAQTMGERFQKLLKLNEALFQEISKRRLDEIPSEKLIKLFLEASSKIELSLRQVETIENDDEVASKEPIVIKLAYSDSD